MSALITGKNFMIVPKVTTTERNALTATNGMLVYDTTLNLFYKYENGSWSSFGGIGNFIDLPPIATPAYNRGRVYFDDTNDCLAFMDSISGRSVQVGYEVLMLARNNTGSQINNGQVVYINGSIGTNSTVALAQANAEATSLIIGVATHNIAINTVGKIVVFGLANDLDTSAFTDGQEIFLSPTVAGGLTSTPPASPNFVVRIGIVERAHPTQGKILVKPEITTANNNSLGTSQRVAPTQNSVKTYVDTQDAGRQAIPIAQAVSTDVAINSITPVTVVSKSVTVAAGDSVKLRVVGNLLNNSGGSRSYTHIINFGTLAVSITDGAVIANSATNESIHEIEATVSIISTSNVHVSGELDRGAPTTINTAGSIGTATVRKAWNTSASNLTGTQTVSYQVQSDNASATQTFKLRYFEYTVIKSNP